MPREIDCPVCENTGVLLDGDTCGHCKGTGLLKLYSEEELQEAIKQEREDIAVMVDEMYDDWSHLESYTIAGEIAEQIRAKGK